MNAAREPVPLVPPRAAPPAELTREQLQAAFDRIVGAAGAPPAGWPATLDEALACPLKSGIVRAAARQAARDADLRARATVPLRVQRADGEWRTRRVPGGPTDQLALSKELK